MGEHKYEPLLFLQATRIGGEGRGEAIESQRPMIEKERTSWESRATYTPEERSISQILGNKQLKNYHGNLELAKVLAHGATTGISNLQSISGANN